MMTFWISLGRTPKGDNPATYTRMREQSDPLDGIEFEVGGTAQLPMGIDVSVIFFIYFHLAFKVRTWIIRKPFQLVDFISWTPVPTSIIIK